MKDSLNAFLEDSLNALLEDTVNYFTLDNTIPSQIPRRCSLIITHTSISDDLQSFVNTGFQSLARISKGRIPSARDDPRRVATLGSVNCSRYFDTILLTPLFSTDAI